jgi:hypothetical protein
MSDVSPNFSGLFEQMTALNQPPAPPQAQLPPIPDVAQPIPRGKENVSPEIMAQVQGIVWGNGAPPPPPAAGNPNAGQVPAMNKGSGWGRVGG